MNHRSHLLLGSIVATLLLGPLASSPMAIPPFGAWSTPVNLGGLVNTAAGEFFPAISKDGLSLYFTAQSCPATTACRPGFGGWDIYVSQRVALDEPWSVPQNAGPSVNSEFDDVSPDLSPDGHRLFFASNRPGGIGGNDIYVAWRTHTHDDFDWQPADNLGTGVNSSVNDAGPSLLSGENGVEMLYFDSNRPEGPGPFTEDVVHNGNDIYVSRMGADGTFGPAALVGELSTPFADRSPEVRRDGLEMIFHSNRPEGRIGVVDLWVSTRDSIDAAWSAPVNLGPVINGVNQQAGAALSFDGRTLYFQASALSHPGFGNYDLFAATRDRLNGGGHGNR